MRRFSGRLIAAALVIAAGFVAAQLLGLELAGPAATPRGARTPSSQPRESAGIEVDGNALIAKVLADALERYPNLACRFRQTLRIGDESLTGVGEYWQQGVGNTRRTCWQWQTLVGGQKAMFCQVLDKNQHLWTDRRFPEKRTVTRVDVNALHRQLSIAAPSTEQGRGAPTADELVLLARGGLSQLVAELRRSFTFERPQAIVEDGKPLVAVVGHWRKERLAEIWPAAADLSPADWPAHVPHHVVVKVGPKDLIPYTIEYRSGTDAADAANVSASADPMARFEFYDVRLKVVMPDRLFEFMATDVDWRDVTESVRWRLAPPAAKPEPAVARREGAWRR